MAAATSNPIPQGSYVTGIILFLVPVLMFFLGLTSAMVVRKGLGDDWMPLTLPDILLGTTAILLFSSVTLEIARRSRRRQFTGAFQIWWGVTTALGFTFLAGQWMAWRELVGQGIYISSNPSSSFFYVLTVAHAVHLLGGLAGLLLAGYVPLTRMTRPTAVRVGAIYWHFMGGLWVYVYLLLWLGR